MKLATVHVDGQDRVCVEIDDDSLLDISETVAGSMRKLLDMGDSGFEAAGRALASSNGTRLKKAAVHWRPPVTNPGKICGVAMNNSASNPRKIKAPDHPAFFLKPASCLVGHQEPIEIRRYYGSVHPEPELAVIIGKPMRDVDAADAIEYVAGYTILNDITGNGMRAEDMFQYWALYASKDDPAQTERREQHLSYAGRYKGCDGFGAMGPWLVTRDEIDDPNDLAVRCEVGGDTVAEDSTRYYNYRVEEVLSFISQFHTLSPGDVVSCGTAFKPSANRRSIHTANFQVVDGPVIVEIEGLGRQENPIRLNDAPMGNWRLSSSEQE